MSQQATVASKPEEDKVHPLKCPICGIVTEEFLRMNDGVTKSDWFRCPCGVIVQNSTPTNNVYDEAYIKQYDDFKEFQATQEHLVKCYESLIEELTMGRKMLDVGFGSNHAMQRFKKRGWVARGIDINNSIEFSQDSINADYEKFDFLKESPKHWSTKEYDLVWMNRIFEHFSDPLVVLNKTKELLSETGVLFICTPDVDFISKTGIPNWPHWKAKEHFVLWNQRALTRELERIGFEVIMVRRNYASRFPSWYDIHLIAQKKYY